MLHMENPNGKWLIYCYYLYAYYFYIIYNELNKHFKSTYIEIKLYKVGNV